MPNGGSSSFYGAMMPCVASATFSVATDTHRIWVYFDYSLCGFHGVLPGLELGFVLGAWGLHLGVWALRLVRAHLASEPI